MTYRDRREHEDGSVTVRERISQEEFSRVFAEYLGPTPQWSYFFFRLDEADKAGPFARGLTERGWRAWVEPESRLPDFIQVTCSFSRWKKEQP